MHYYITAEFEGENQERRRTDVSAKVAKPVFSINTFLLPMFEDNFQQNQRLMVHAHALAVREEHLSEEEINSRSKLLGTAYVDMTPLIAEQLSMINPNRPPVRRQI